MVKSDHIQYSLTAVGKVAADSLVAKITALDSDAARTLYAESIALGSVHTAGAELRIRLATALNPLMVNCVRWQLYAETSRRCVFSKLLLR